MIAPAPENWESFFNRIRPLFPPSVILDFELAYLIAKAGHQYQVRKELDPGGEPVRYFEHPRAATLILFDELKIADRVMAIAIIFHDCPEDTKRVHIALIEHAFGAEIAQIVVRVTKDPKDGYYERLLDYADWRTIVCKLCDVLHNMRTLGFCTDEFIAKQIANTEAHIYPLLDRLLAIIPAEYRTRAHWLRDEIRGLVTQNTVRLAEKARPTA